MKNLCISKNLLLDFFLPKHHICSRITVKRKVAITIHTSMYKRKRRMHSIICHQIIYIDSLVFHRLRQHCTKHVCSYFPNKCSLFSKILQHGKYIARSTARICFKQRISLRTHSIFCKIYQQFSKCCYIKLFHIGFSLHTLRHNDIIFFKIYNGFSIAHKTDLIRFERCVKCCTEYLLSIIQKNFH